MIEYIARVVYKKRNIMPFIRQIILVISNILNLILDPIFIFIFKMGMMGVAFASVISFVRYENFVERMTYLFSYLKDCICRGHFRYYYLDSKGKTFRILN